MVLTKTFSLFARTHPFLPPFFPICGLPPPRENFYVVLLTLFSRISPNRGEDANLIYPGRDSVAVSPALFP